MRSPLFLFCLFLCLCLGRLYLVLKLVNCQYLYLYVFPLVFILLWLFSTVQLCLVPHLPLETVCTPTYEGILFSPFLVLELDPPHSYTVTHSFVRDRLSPQFCIYLHMATSAQFDSVSYYFCHFFPLIGLILPICQYFVALKHLHFFPVRHNEASGLTNVLHNKLQQNTDMVL